MPSAAAAAAPVPGEPQSAAAALPHGKGPRSERPNGKGAKSPAQLERDRARASAFWRGKVHGGTRANKHGAAAAASLADSLDKERAKADFFQEERDALREAIDESLDPEIALPKEMLVDMARRGQAAKAAAKREAEALEARRLEQTVWPAMVNETFHEPMTFMDKHVFNPVRHWAAGKLGLSGPVLETRWARASDASTISLLKRARSRLEDVTFSGVSAHSDTDSNSIYSGYASSGAASPAVRSSPAYPSSTFGDDVEYTLVPPSAEDALKRHTELLGADGRFAPTPLAGTEPTRIRILGDIDVRLPYSTSWLRFKVDVAILSELRVHASSLKERGEFKSLVQRKTGQLPHTYRVGLDYPDVLPNTAEVAMLLYDAKRHVLRKRWDDELDFPYRQVLIGTFLAIGSMMLFFRARSFVLRMIGLKSSALATLSIIYNPVYREAGRFRGSCLTVLASRATEIRDLWLQVLSIVMDALHRYQTRRR